MQGNEVYDDHNPPDFLGFYSPIIDGTLISLMNASTPGKPEYERYAKGTDRFISLDILEKEAVDSENSTVEKVIQQATADKKPIGLYLRNFALGARARPAQQELDGLPQILTLYGPDDDAMQRQLNSEFHDILFVAISNPAFHTRFLPQIILSDDQWQQTADALIKQADIIVMFFLTATPGVNSELELLRAAGAQQRTIIVIASEDPRDSSLEKSLIALAGEKPEQTVDTATLNSDALNKLLADFPHIVHLERNGKRQALADAVIRVMQATPAIRSTGQLVIPPRPKPSGQLLKLAGNGALNEFDNGMRSYEAGDGRAAEDAFIRSIVFSYWAWDRLGRAVAFLNLGHTERYLLKYPNEAVDCYFKSLDLMVSILPVSQTARESYKVLALGLSEYLKELGDSASAQSVVDKYLSES